MLQSWIYFLRCLKSINYKVCMSKSENPAEFLELAVIPSRCSSFMLVLIKDIISISGNMIAQKSNVIVPFYNRRMVSNLPPNILCVHTPLNISHILCLWGPYTGWNTLDLPSGRVVNSRKDHPYDHSLP